MVGAGGSRADLTDGLTGEARGRPEEWEQVERGVRDDGHWAWDSGGQRGMVRGAWDWENAGSRDLQLGSLKAPGGGNMHSPGERNKGLCHGVRLQQGPRGRGG